MPYTEEQLKSKESYKNIIDADKNTLKKFFEEESLKANVSGSDPNAINTLRDSNGVLLSYENPDKLGSTFPSKIQLTRLKMEYYDALPEEVEVKLKGERTFGEGFRPTPDGRTDEQLLKDRETEVESKLAEIKATEEQLEKKEKDLADLSDKLGEEIEKYALKLSQLEDEE